MEKSKIILIQGALDIELEYLMAHLENKRLLKIEEYEFYEGYILNQKVVISKTLVGTIHSTIATTIGILTFHPDVVLNQGIAGAHSEDLHIGDIVIGESCVNINSYKMPLKGKKEGSNPFEWELNKRARDIKNADSNLINILEKELTSSSNKIYKGILGSGDVFNREYDRIHWIHDTFHNLCEDMESIGAYSVCSEFHVSCVGIRIISNNELLQEEIDKKVAIELQQKILPIIDRLVGGE